MMLMNRTENDFDVELRDMTDADWANMCFMLSKQMKFIINTVTSPPRI